MEAEWNDRQPIYRQLRDRAVALILKVIWVAMAIAWLVLALRADHPEASGALLVGPLTLLGFPTSYAATWLIAGTSFLLDYVNVPLTGKAAMFATWLALATAGYLQWFHLLPLLLRSRKRAA